METVRGARVIHSATMNGPSGHCPSQQRSIRFRKRKVVLAGSRINGCHVTAQLAFLL